MDQYYIHCKWAWPKSKLSIDVLTTPSIIASIKRLIDILSTNIRRVDQLIVRRCVKNHYPTVKNLRRLGSWWSMSMLVRSCIAATLVPEVWARSDGQCNCYFSLLSFFFNSITYFKIGVNFYVLASTASSISNFY